MKWILGIAIERNASNNTTLIHQHKYIMDMVNRFGQTDAALVSLPYAVGDEKQPEDVQQCTAKECSLYRSIVGNGCGDESDSFADSRCEWGFAVWVIFCRTLFGCFLG